MINDIEAYIQALEDITDKDLFKALEIVCNDIQVKEQTEEVQCGWYGSIQQGGYILSPSQSFLPSRFGASREYEKAGYQI